MDSGEIGKLGEDLAVKYLKKKGFKILDRNFEIHSSGRVKGEIDIIAKKNKSISFVEVKALKRSAKQASNVPCFFPQDKVNAQKKRKITRTAEIWLERNNISLESLWSIDVVAMFIDFEKRRAQVMYFPNI